MKNYVKVFIVIIIVIIAVIGIFGYMQFQDSNSSIQVGKTIFKLPEGYKEVGWTNNNTAKISDGKNTAFISLRENDDLDYEVRNFAHGFNRDEKPTTITNFTVDNVFVYKLTIENDTQDCYYWFKNNGEVYGIYMWDGNNKIETVVFDLIRSMK